VKGFVRARKAIIMKITISKLLMALSVAALNFAGTARADVTIRVDNYLNPSAYQYAGSYDTLEVCIYTTGVDWPPYQFAPDGWRCRSRVVSSLSGTHDFEFNEGKNDAGQVKKVGIRIHGPDLFIVDQWEMFSEGGDTAVESRGVDNEEGYCLSTDDNDFSNSHCWSGVNSAGLVWTLPGWPLVL
jgi:hypothetical protein